MREEDFTSLSKIGPVGRPHHVGIIVRCVLACGEFGPVCENCVVCLEKGFGHICRTAHNHVVVPELELHERPVYSREIVD